LAELGPFDAGTLEREYGYPPDEALAAAGFLGGVRVPVGHEGRFARDHYPVITGILRETREAGELTRRVTGAFGGDGGTVIGTSDTVPLVFGDSAEAGPTLAELGPFDAETLEREYGYPPGEALSAAGFLGGVRVPVGHEGRFARDHYPIITGILGETREAGELMRRVTGALGGGGGTVIGTSDTVPPVFGDAHAVAAPVAGTPATPLGLGPWTPLSGTVPVARWVDGGARVVPFEWKSARGLDATSSMFPRPDLSPGAPSAHGRAETDAPMPATGPVVTAPPARRAADAELESHRRKEANYERDKALERREKLPALARSETHDVGHAEGTAGKEAMSAKSVSVATKEILRMVRQSTKRMLGTSSKRSGI
jgi:hypothetical protein